MIIKILTKTAVRKDSSDNYNKIYLIRLNSKINKKNTLCLRLEGSKNLEIPNK